METVRSVTGVGTGMNRQGIEDFKGSKNILYTIIMVATCHYTFAQTPRVSNTKREPYCNYRLWVIMCHCRFIGSLILINVSL